VVVVVDQMRADYVDRFARDWTAGLKRLVTHGAWFRNAAYPYLTTVTCAGHATIATGAFPHVHGVFQNAWWDRDQRKLMTCTEDPRASDIGYGFPVAGGDSAYRLQVPTVTDVLRTERHAHVVTLSLKARSAIMLAGHGGDAVTWLSEMPGGWITSSVYAEAPVAAVRAFVDAHPMTADFGKTWSRLLPPSSYAGPDDAVGETPPEGWTRTFPHALVGTGETASDAFFAQWLRSPFADEYLARLGATLAEALHLGRHDGIDVLGISFSSPDLVGHAFGPRSHEVRDMYAHLDRTLGTLFDRLDALVGRDQWVVALTGDHGVTPIPDQLTAAGRDAGRINPATIVNAVEDRLRPVLGGGSYVAQIFGNDIYFESGVYDTIRASAPLLGSVIAAISAVPGIERVFRSEEVRDATGAADRLQRAAALSYFPGRSGDLIIVPRPGWMFSASGTTHGSANADDQRVPLLFMGVRIKPGRYRDPATPADIAPTLADICGITLPAAEGHALRVAVQ
jgi:predicted AlkP superfamily pyrophosphatase or phosphodiesterase